MIFCISGFPLWLVMAIFLFPVYPDTESITLSESEKDNINAGLEIGTGLSGLLESRSFARSMSRMALSVGPYLGAIGPFVGLIMAFIPSDTAELAFAKKMMKQIDNRLDRVDSQFNNVEKLIQWNAVKVNFGQIEQKILAMSKEFQLMYEVPQSAVKNRKILFVNHYHSDYQNSGFKLYHALIGKQGTFQENLGTSVMRYTKNDRKLTQGFLLGIMKLLLQAVKIELAYLQVQRFDNNVVFMKKKWEKRFKEVTSNFEAVDLIVKKKYHVQAGIDTTDLAVKSRWMTNKQFAAELFKMLKGKYYWRDWIVLVYNQVSGWKNQAVSQCGGLVKFRTQGRNIVIASRDRNHTVMDLKRAEQDMKKVVVARRSGSWWTGYSTNPDEAKTVYQSLNKTGACNVAVIKCGSGLHYKFHARRFMYVNRCPYFSLSMWG